MKVWGLPLKRGRLLVKAATKARAVELAREHAGGEHFAPRQLVRSVSTPELSVAEDTGDAEAVWIAPGQWTGGRRPYSRLA